MALAVCLAGCSPPAGDGTLEVWAWNIAAASLMKCVEPFEAEHPDTRIQVNMTGTNMQSRFLLALSAGVGAPSVSQMELTDAPRFTYTLRLTDLTDRAAPYADAFPASFWKNCMFDGRVYAIPWDMGPCAIYYKRRIFTQYGIDPESIATWADYIEAGKKIVSDSGGRTKMLNLGIQGGSIQSMFEILLQQVRGQLFDDEGRIALYSNESLRVLGLIEAMLDSGICMNTAPFSHEDIAGFKTDAVATYPMAVWFGGSLKDYAPTTSGEWGVFRLPAFEPGGLRVSNLGGSVLVIPEETADKEGAWAFVEFCLCNPKTQLFQYEHFDLFPCLTTTFDDPFFDEPDPFYAGQKVRRLFATEIDQIPTLNRTKDWKEAMRYLNQDLVRWVSGGLDAREVLAALELKLSRRLNREIAPGSLSRAEVKP